jgi:hypothetical protein
MADAVSVAAVGVAVGVGVAFSSLRQATTTVSKRKNSKVRSRVLRFIVTSWCRKRWHLALQIFYDDIVAEKRYGHKTDTRWQGNDWLMNCLFMRLTAPTPTVWL